VLTTTDGGQSWETTSLVEGTYTCMYFADADHGCALGYNDSSFIMVTEDGGESWQLPNHPKALRLNSTYFHDADIGWAAGITNGNNYQLGTDDGGQTWLPQSTIYVQGAELFSVHFRDAQSGNACGAQGAFFITNSGGNNWALNIDIPSLGEDLYDLYNWGMFTGCVVGTSGTALYTTNRWSGYTETNTNTTETLYAVSGAPTTNKLWAAGANGTIIHTPNYMLGWTTQASGTAEDLLDIQMLDENNGWAVGKNGTILQYVTGTGFQDNVFTGFRIYPNPTSGQLTLVLNLPERQPVKMEICDLHGRVVTAALNETLSSGTHLVDIDASQLPEGIYFARLQAGKTTLTRKITKLD
jgi:photosystem II stability/assembly factor-like uncharacterized protein